MMQGICSKAANITENKRKFTSQDLDNEFEINLYQMRYRNHDSQIGRFIQIDPLADDYVHNSTYAYAENDVIRAIDLEGLEKFIVTSQHTQGINSKVTIHQILRNETPVDNKVKLNSGFEATKDVLSFNNLGSPRTKTSAITESNSLSNKESFIIREGVQKIEEVGEGKKANVRIDVKDISG